MLNLSITATGYPQLIEGFRKLAAKISDFRFIWPQMAAHFYEIEKQTFASQGRSAKWAPLSAGYGRWKAAKFPGKPILQREGALIASLTQKGTGIYDAQPLSLTLGTKVPYASAHQYGGRLPARPVIDLTDKDMESFTKILQKGAVTIVEDAGFHLARVA